MWFIIEEKMLVVFYFGVYDDLVENEGYVIFYGDFFLDIDKVGENVYIDIFNYVREYVYIMIFYLILDSELEYVI